MYKMIVLYHVTGLIYGFISILLYNALEFIENIGRNSVFGDPFLYQY